MPVQRTRCESLVLKVGGISIGAFEPFTLTDFPGSVAALVFVRGCNFRCPFCHNGRLLEAAPPLAPELVLHRLEERRGKIDGVVVTGGEPTLQAALPDFLSRVRSLGFTVKLDTNGSRPGMLRRLLDRHLLDYIAMDLKAPPRLYRRVSGSNVLFSSIRKSIGLIASSGIPHEFRTTFVPSLLGDHDLEIIRSLVPVGSAYKIQPFRRELALDGKLRRTEQFEQLRLSI